MKYLDGVPDADIDRITHLNAMRNFHYDPFAHIPREQATVGALRAQATDVDTTPGEPRHRQVPGRGHRDRDDPGRAHGQRRSDRRSLPGAARPRRREPLLLDLGRGRPAPVPPLPGVRLLPAPAAAPLPECGSATWRPTR